MAWHYLENDPTREFCLLTMIKHAVCGVCELHKLGFVHHDIKFKNILYKKTKEDEYHFVLCDFEGACRPSEDGPSLWEMGWDLLKYTKRYLPENYDSLPPWRIDFAFSTFAGRQAPGTAAPH